MYLKYNMVEYNIYKIHANKNKICRKIYNFSVNTKNVQKKH